MSQDFSHQNLRGRSFKGQDLSGANFSGADIRSCNFSGANLKGANFARARAGLQQRWINGLVLLSWLLSGLSVLAAKLIAGTVTLVFEIIRLQKDFSAVDQRTALIISITAAVVFIIFCGLTIKKGLGASLAVITLTTLLIVGVSLGSVALGLELYQRTFGFLGIRMGLFLLFTSVSGIVNLGIIIAGIGLEILAVAFNVCVNLVGLKTGIWGVFLFASLGIYAIEKPLTNITAAYALSAGVSIAFVLLGAYIGWSSLVEDEKYNWISPLALALITTGGASFYRADLTNANFTSTILKSTNFRKAILIHTCFHQAKMLENAHPGKTYLKNVQIRLALVNKQGQGKNFDHQDLRTVNLQGANLTDASFIGADLSHANLQDADLTRAKLVQTQLDGTDFTGATLTGAYIEDWNITTDTKFDGVRCDYVYMRLPTQDNPDPHRKPDNRQEVFADGEFGDFIKPIFDTLDLYHSQGVDPRAVAISFKQLAENHPEADLRIVGMEVRGEDKFLLRAKTATAADKSELSAEYFTMYNQLKALAEQEVKALIAEKDSRIADLQNMVVTALQRPSFYSNVEQVGFMTNNPGGISQNVSGGQVYGGMQAAQGNHNVQTSTTNSSSEQKQNLAEAAAEIQQLLEQLSQSYPTETMSGKMALAAEATQRIENNPTLMHKTISALRAGGTAALEQFLSHPAASFVIAALDDWSKNNP